MWVTKIKNQLGALGARYGGAVRRDGTIAVGVLELHLVGLLALRDVAVGLVAIIDSRMAVDGDSLSSESTLGATEQALLQRTHYQKLIQLLSNMQLLYTFPDVLQHTNKVQTTHQPV